MMVFDLDPSGDDFAAVCSTARDLRSLLEELGLPSFVKTTGSKGLHIVVPLDRKARFAEVRRFAEDVASLLAAGAPNRLTLEQRKAKRSGRLFLDYMRNGYGATVVAPYSVRARPGAPVAVPLDWAEVDDASLRPDGFGLVGAAERARSGDPWAGWRRRARSLGRARRRLDARLHETAPAST
jgi:bifunctional non-homologous end joining protein LigD